MSSGILKANDLDEIKEVIESEEAFLMIERDVYWPKWDSPWWYMLLMDETERTKEIPVDVLKELLVCADRQYLKIFPANPGDVPEQVNSCTEVMCFCFLGNLMRLGSILELDVFAYMPWAEEWVRRYQLPDGGYNCDEIAYQEQGKSSVVSTAAMLEGMVEYSRFIGDNERFAANMQKAVSYLLKHQFYLSSTGSEIEGVEWEKIIFPRFYEYDFSRGLEAVLDFLDLTGKKIRAKAAEKAIKLLDEKVKNKLDYSEKQWLSNEKTVSYYIENPVMFKDMANLPLLMKLMNSTSPNQFVPAMLNRIAQKLAKAQAAGQLVD